MTACLVQQLFRQKIGQELDQNIVDGVLFPLLRSRKNLPKELHQDIKLTHSCYGPISAGRGPDLPISPFTPIQQSWQPVVFHIALREAKGKITSKFRRYQLGPRRWGTIEILNELRSLKHPRMGYHQDAYNDSNEDCFFSGDEFEHAYLRLEEDESIPGTSSWCIEREKSLQRRTRFVYHFLEDALNTDKRISWGGDPDTMFEPILSNNYPHEWPLSDRWMSGKTFIIMQQIRQMNAFRSNTTDPDY